MGKLYDQAELIKNKLATLSSFINVPILIDRQKDIESEFKKAIGKQGGAVVYISIISGRNSDLDAELVSLKTSISISIITKPILRSGQPEGIEMLEEAIVELHDFKIDNSDHCTRSISVESWRLISNPIFLIYEIKLSTPTTLI